MNALGGACAGVVIAFMLLGIEYLFPIPGAILAGCIIIILAVPALWRGSEIEAKAFWLVLFLMVGMGSVWIQFK